MNPKTYIVKIIHLGVTIDDMTKIHETEIRICVRVKYKKHDVVLCSCSKLDTKLTRLAFVFRACRVMYD